MEQFKNLRRDPVDPNADFWRSMRIGLVIAVIVFVLVWVLT